MALYSPSSTIFPRLSVRFQQKSVSGFSIVATVSPEALLMISLRYASEFVEAILKFAEWRVGDIKRYCVVATAKLCKRYAEMEIAFAVETGVYRRREICRPVEAATDGSAFQR